MTTAHQRHTPSLRNVLALAICFCTGLMLGNSRSVISDMTNLGGTTRSLVALTPPSGKDDGSGNRSGSTDKLDKSEIVDANRRRDRDRHRHLLLERLRTSSRSSVLGAHPTGGALFRNLSSLDGQEKRRQHPSLLYILVPKAGSTTMKTLMKKINDTSAGDSLFNPATQIGSDAIHFRNDLKFNGPTMNRSEFYMFSMLRDPRERFMSSYSTTISRRNYYPNGVIARCRGESLHLVSPPIPQTNLTAAWRAHFARSMEQWAENIADFGWTGTHRCRWNEHVVPQVEFLRGYNIHHIGCMEAMDDTLDVLNLTGYDSDTGHGEKGVLRNAYEHNPNFMPNQKFQYYDLLSNRTKALIEEIYKEDFELYDAFCGWVRFNASQDAARRCVSERQNGSRCSGFWN